MEHFKEHPSIKVNLIVSNKADAAVLELADQYRIGKLVLNRDYFYKSEEILMHFDRYNINFISLAGFLWLIPAYIVHHFRGSIVNIHPALLPKYGGKGMYGSHVHKAVHAAGEKRSGITIHQVNENYDEGNYILQAFCDLNEQDKPEDIARKVLSLEHFYYPRTIEHVITKKRTV